MRVAILATALQAILSPAITVLAGRPSDKSLVRKRKRGGTTAFAAAGEVTLIVKVSSDNGKVAALGNSNNGQSILKNLEKRGIIVMNVEADKVETIKNELLARDDVEAVEEDQEVRAFSSAEMADLRGRRLTEEATPWGIDMVNSMYVNEMNTPEGFQAKKICVVDTGYGNGHPDLPVLNTTTDGFNPYTSGLWHVDGNSHGTHCAGTIGAIGGNDEGVTSVNPNSTKFSFFIGKGLTDMGTGSSVGVMSAVQACVDNGSDLISMSLGGGPFSQIESDEFLNHYNNGVLIIAAAGNAGNDVKSYPASYRSVMSVSAVDVSQDLFIGNQYNDQIEISAPGVSVQSTITANGGTTFDYDSYTGTSMACPHVSGVTALVWSHFAQCSNKQIRGAMIKSARDRGGAGCDVNYGHGIVDAKAMYDLLVEGCTAGNIASIDENDPPGGCLQWPENINSVSPTLSPTPFACSNGTIIKLELTTDEWPGDTTWNIQDSSGTILIQRGPYGLANTLHEEYYCDITTDEKTFTIFDSFGDGICCFSGEGSYILWEGSTQVGYGGDFGSSETVTFMHSSTSPTISLTEAPSTSPTTAAGEALSTSPTTITSVPTKRPRAITPASSKATKRSKTSKTSKSAKSITTKRPSEKPTVSPVMSPTVPRPPDITPAPSKAAKRSKKSKSVKITAFSIEIKRTREHASNTDLTVKLMSTRSDQERT